MPLILLIHVIRSLIPDATMAPERARQQKKQPALKELQSFESSCHLTCVMKDALVGEPSLLLGEMNAVLITCKIRCKIRTRQPKV